MNYVLLCSAAALCIVGNPNASFGERQVRQMLADRPEMEGVLDGETAREVSAWLAMRFDGTSVATRVYWNAEEPASGFYAEHARRYHIYPAQVRVVSNKNLSGLDKWLAVIFELHNLENSKDFEKLERLVRANQLSCEAYTEKAINLELEAVVKTAEFLRKKLAPSQLQKSLLYDQYRKVVKNRDEGLAFDTGQRHRDYYRLTYERLKAWESSR